jgi:integrase
MRSNCSQAASLASLASTHRSQARSVAGFSSPTKVLRARTESSHAARYSSANAGLPDRRTLLAMFFGKPASKSSSDGEYPAGHPRNVRRILHVLLDAAQLPRIRFHDLRHSAASLLIAEGVELVEVSLLLGHSASRITADLYTHLVKQTSAKAARYMDAVLLPQGVT